MTVFAVLLNSSFVACSSEDDDDRIRSSGQVPETVEAVDLGLSVLWANLNIDATSPYMLGSWFVWGDTVKENNGNLFIAYKYQSSNESIFKNSKNTEYSTTYGELLTISGTEYDPARITWSNGWRLPTVDEFLELQKYCSCTLSEDESFITIKSNVKNDSIILTKGSYLSGSYGTYTDNTGKVLFPSIFIYNYRTGINRTHGNYLPGYVRPVKDK